MPTPHANAEHPMVTLRVVRHDRHEELLAECLSAVLPTRGELLQLDTLDGKGGQSQPSTMWRVASVTVHVPSLASQRPADGSLPVVQQVEVSVLPDVMLMPELTQAAAARLTESRM